VAANAAAAAGAEDLAAQAARLERALEDKATALEETHQWNKRGGGWFAKLNAGVSTDAKGLDLASQLDTALSKTLADLEAKANSANSLFRSEKAREELKAETAKLASELADVRGLGAQLRVVIVELEARVAAAEGGEAAKSAEVTRLETELAGMYNALAGAGAEAAQTETELRDTAAAAEEAAAAAAVEAAAAASASAATAESRAADLERQLLAANAAAAAASDDLAEQAARLELALADKAAALEETNQWNKRGGGWFANLSAGVTTDAKVGRFWLIRG